MPSTTPIAIAERRSAILAATLAAMAASPRPAWSSATRAAAQTPGTTVTVDGRVRELVCRGKAGIALSASPTQTRIGYPFRLRSIDGSVFMFEVEGHVEVVRQ